MTLEHSTATQLVSHFAPYSKRSEISRRVTLAELTQGLTGQTHPKHLTASALVFSGEGVLLHWHRKANAWLQPGGHIEPGETPEEAALREVAEETGVGIDGWLFDGRLVNVDVHPASGHVHFDLLFAAVVTDWELAPGEGESPAVRWATAEQAFEIVDDPIRDAIAFVESSATLARR